MKRYLFQQLPIFGVITLIAMAQYDFRGAPGIKIETRPLSRGPPIFMLGNPAARGERERNLAERAQFSKKFEVINVASRPSTRMSSY